MLFINSVCVFDDMVINLVNYWHIFTDIFLFSEVVNGIIFILAAKKRKPGDRKLGGQTKKRKVEKFKGGTFKQKKHF